MKNFASNNCPFGEIDEEQLYPAVHHFRVITLSESAAFDEIDALLAIYTTETPLCRGQSSSGGRYQTLHVSVRLSDRAEHQRLDSALRGVNGVKFLL